MNEPRQMALALAHRPSLGRSDFLVSDSNRTAFEAATHGHTDMRLALSGPEGAGKTHLASIWGRETGAVSISATELTEPRLERLMAEAAVVVEDADRMANLPGPAQRQVEALLFHLYNLGMAEGRGLLITGRKPPARWDVQTPDLASRLASMDHIAIEPPDDELLSAILRKLFKDRQLTVGVNVLEYLVRRMERTFAAAEQVVEDLDRMALAEKRAITRPLAARLFGTDMDETGKED